MPHAYALQRVSMRVRHSALRFTCLSAALVGGVPYAGAQTPANLTGRVVDAATRQPVASAQVVITAANRMAVTTENGVFELRDLPGGTHLVAVRRIGYEARQDTVQLRTGESRRMDIALAPRPLPLPEVAVAAERGYIGGFWERRANTQGHFITRDDILKRNPARLVEMFHGVPGVIIVSTGWGHLVATRRGSRTIDVRRSGSPSGECAAAVFLNGAPYFMSSAGLGDFALDDVEGIEYYSSPARTPPQFNATGSLGGPDRIAGDPRCGVLVIWTRGQP